MKRILLLTTLAAMLAAAMALSGVAQAAPISDKADAQCAKLAIKTLGPSFNPGTYTFFGGTEGPDAADRQRTGGPDVFCGFGGNDFVAFLQEGDIFLGGEGNDRVDGNRGTFYGGAGDDQVGINEVPGTFNGGAGNDHVTVNIGTFVGGEGNDSVSSGNPPVDGSP